MIVVSGIWWLNGHRRVIGGGGDEIAQDAGSNCFALGDWMGDFTSGAFAGFSAGLVLMAKTLSRAIK